MTLARGLLVVAAVLASATGWASQSGRALTPDDLYRVADVSDAQVSVDGQWVAYVVTSNDRDSDQARSAIWMVSWDGEQRVALTAPSDGPSKPRWSPDGRYLAFLMAPASGDKARLMLVDRRGGDARPVCPAAAEIGEYSWAPDGKRIVVAMVPSAADASPKPIVIDALHFKQDDSGYLAQGEGRHLFVCDVETGLEDALTSDPQFTEDAPAWSIDGRSIAFTRTHERGADPDGREDIAVMEARAGAAVRTLARPFAPNTQRLTWSADDGSLVFLQGIEPKFNAYIQDRLFTVGPGAAPRAFTDSLDRAVLSYALDGTTAILAVEDDRTVYPARLDLNSGRLSRAVPTGQSVVSSITSAAGHTALIESSDAQLAEVYALDGGGLRKLTSHNDAFVAEIQWGAVEDLSFRSKGGAEVHAMLVKPPDFSPSRQYPLLLWIHGGPNGQDEHSLVLDGYEFEPQMFAAKGFLVLRVNYRGGSGRGAKFAQEIFADWGHKEVQDLLAGVDAVIARGIVDKNRLAVGGWSYGGILTDYTIASDHRFKAAISGAGSANQLSTYGTDQYVLQYNNELGTPWTNTSLWLKLSYPFFHADRINTPTLFLGGDKDFNVPVVGGEQMYQSLRVLGVPAQLVVYPGEHHVFTRPSFVKDLADRTAAWLDRYVTVH